MADSSKPSLSFCGLAIYGDREGDHFTGRVEFPHESNGRTECPIDYRSLRPDAAVSGVGRALPAAQYRDREGAALDARTAKRLRLAKEWGKLCNDNPYAAKGVLAQQVAKAGGVSARSVQQWARKLDTEGPDGLRDRYVPATKKVLTIEANHARDVVLICAWWAFRIGNCECIDTKMVHTAVTQLIEPGHLVADVLATIDCYYSYKCDRTRMPFKPFQRWATYDFPVPWLYRACDENDYRRGLQAARKERTLLQAPRTTMSSTVASAQMRRREVLHAPTRKAIGALSPEAAISHQPSAVSSEQYRDRKGAAPVSTFRRFDISTFPPPLESSNPQPFRRFDVSSNPLRTAGMLQSFGLRDAATRVIQAAAPGIPALAANKDPQTIAEALGSLEDGYRRMLSKAARGDRDARKQAVATMPLWWDAMPRQVRNNIDFQVAAWQRDHPNVTNGTASARKLDMLLSKLRSDRTGAQRLFPAARIPV